ncbi:poly(A) polymerase [Rickettsia sp. MEAM1 (Bemisia tabaci)]|uniref:CCA tRNA nucleotidyltransferase n=1 Tax=unclassified Rickettsia TaxID=114295 RepID=UPI0002F106B5|nr:MULTISPECIES: CCA tRNA nucleotidyltransferase [unclassified Rickettsia]ASX28014.1 poly(A) polymerase [Rickettsia sp. MEAM1 (Bemisia tabaci)]ODA37486.1 poly(A) polymerase [Rickettsia sp. wb]ODA38242.1 poly(A) polymerase [Rickettsia sp. wq]
MQTINKILNIPSKGYEKILSLLNKKGEARLIGGSVRDALLGKDSYDIDIATNLLPNEVTSILSQAKIKTIPTGLKFGTITAILEKEQFQITTLRKDIECNGRHAKVVFTNDFAEDAERRDFTINALSYCHFKGKIYDYFNGFEDLKQQKVIFIRAAHQRIKEDYLRILRFFRFSSYYANRLDPEGFKACDELKSGLMSLSRERIKSEFDRIIVSSNSPEVLKAMFEIGILALIFSIQNYEIKIAEQAKSFNLELSTRYALLLYYQKDLNLKNFLDWKFSKHETIQILSILDFIHKNIINEFDIKKIWLEHKNYKEYLLAASILEKIDYSQITKFINIYDSLERPKFPINGHDLLNINIEQKDIGEKLNYLKKIWIDQDFKPSKLELVSFLRKQESSNI